MDDLFNMTAQNHIKCNSSVETDNSESNNNVDFMVRMSKPSENMASSLLLVLFCTV